jgi:hypothetical protein
VIFRHEVLLTSRPRPNIGDPERSRIIAALRCPEVCQTSMNEATG